MKKPFTFEEFKSIYSRVPRLCVEAVIQKDGGVILIERTLESWKGQWHLPGGTVYMKETITDALKRIVKEETGLEVVPTELLTYLEYSSEEKERGFGYSVSLVFSCNIVGGSIQLNDEGSDIQAVTSLPDNMVAEHKAFLTTLLT